MQLSPSLTADYTKRRPSGLPPVPANPVIGRIYMDLRGFKVKACKKVDGFKLWRVCTDCDTKTAGMTEAQCWKHGGKGACQTPGCPRRGDPLVCKPCKISKGVLKTCPQCNKNARAKNRPDGRCSNCVVADEVSARREAGRHERKRMAEALELPEAPEDAKDAEKRVRYVHIDQKSDYKPYEVVRGGNQYHRACVDPTCVQIRRGDTLHCKMHGGGNRCTYPGCTKTAQWDRSGACVLCKMHGGGHRCTHPGCTKSAIAEKGGVPLFCIEHGGGKRCAGGTDPETGVQHACGTGVAINSGNRYDGQCVRCFCFSHPNDPRAVNAKKWLNAKEQAVRELLEQGFPNYRWSFDRAYGRSRVTGYPLRPDAQTRRGRRVLIVEVDENSHESYECAKEREKEAIAVLHAGAGSTVVVLRFNPDDYTDFLGVKWPKCFKFNDQSGTVVVDPAQRQQWEHRIAVLLWKISVYVDEAHEDYMHEVPAPLPGYAAHMEELFYKDVRGMSASQVERAYARLRALGKKRAREDV